MTGIPRDSSPSWTAYDAGLHAENGPGRGAVWSGKVPDQHLPYGVTRPRKSLVDDRPQGWAWGGCDGVISSDGGYQDEVIDVGPWGTLS